MADAFQGDTFEADAFQTTAPNISSNTTNSNILQFPSNGSFGTLWENTEVGTARVNAAIHRAYGVRKRR